MTTLSPSLPAASARAHAGVARHQRYVYQQLQGRVPMPEVMGLAEDGNQIFIYMALINAPTLAAR
jgi:hypothetical protein